MRLYWDRAQGNKAKIPKAMDASFADPRSEDERRIHTLIADFDKVQAATFEQEIFKQCKRLANAERTLLTKIKMRERAEDDGFRLRLNPSYGWALRA